LYFLLACVVLAVALLFACHFGVAVENCAAPVDAGDIVTALEAVALAFGLFQGARLFVRGGAYRVRAWLAR